MTFCTRCAAHGTWRWNKLLDVCPSTPPTAQGQRWLHTTMTTGEAPVQLSSNQKATNPPKVKVTNTRTGHTDPLKTKAFADSADKSSWQPCMRPPKTEAEEGA